MTRLSSLMILLVCISLASGAYGQENTNFRLKKNAVPGRYIVVLADEGTSTSIFPQVPRAVDTKKTASELTAAFGGKVENIYTSTLSGFTATMSRHEAERLSSDSRVKYVEEDSFVAVAQTQQSDPPWHLDRIDQRFSNLNQIYSYDSTGTGVRVYVVDTGIKNTHSEFGGRVFFGADFVGDGQNGNDCNGHGTHVAGTVGGTTFGVAKNVSIHNVRVLGCDGRGTASAVLSGVEWIANNRSGPTVVNMSLGSDEPSASIETAIANSITAGIHYSLAAGNGDPAINACNHSPGGRVPAAITVGATIRGDIRAWFSNFGPCIDIFAPGEGILSAGIDSNTSTAEASGTSMSAPQVAGVIARLLQAAPSTSPAQIKAALLLWASRVVRNDGTNSTVRLLYSRTSLTSVPPTSAITLAHGSPANPYPSQFVVSGAPSVLSTKPGSLIVNINGLSAQYANHVVMVLVGPDGTAMTVQNLHNSFFSVFGSSYTITDSARSHMDHVLVDGSSHKPTKMGNLFSLPSPGPGTNYHIPGPWAPRETLSGVFGGKNPNGTWKLYVIDPPNAIEHFDSTITDWSLTINNPQDPYPAPPPPSPTPTPTPSPTPPRAATFDLVEQFSPNSNPNGMWSYGYSRNSIQFTPFNHHGQPWAGIDSWSPLQGGACCGMITKNSGDPLVYYGTIVHDPEYLYMETGPDGENATVRWTAPVSGIYYFRGQFKALDTAYRLIWVSIRRNSSSFGMLDTGLAGYGTTANYNFSLNLTAGEFVDFVVGTTASNEYYGAGLKGTISTDAAVITAADISGRVVTAAGRGLARTVIVATLPSGEKRRYQTNSMGYFNLTKLPTGTISLDISAKPSRRVQRTINLTSNLQGYDIVLD